ncbi:TIGR03790 family protein [Methylomagnum sp.]
MNATGIIAAFALLVGILLRHPALADEPPPVELPKTALESRELALVVNESDPLSVRVAAYYQTQRGIPDQNIIRVRLPPGDNLPREAFERIKQAVDSHTGPAIQGYALAWTAPFRVDCLSITTAFALGFDPAYCSAKQCAMTKPSGYFDAQGGAPYIQHKIRPAMLLAGRDFESVKALIDRGVASDSTFPTGTGYLLRTSDANRSVRSVAFEETHRQLGRAFRLEVLAQDDIRDRRDVLFYFTGLTRVAHLDTLKFLPGAVADHLTSAGGVLTGDGQMSSLRWLDAGATASYGAVVEPCNHLAKFPFPAVLMLHYATGNTVLEAYWKSVAAPGEGVFIGEPLAKPFAPRILARDGRRMKLKLFAPTPGVLGLDGAVSPMGPFRPTGNVYPLVPGVNELSLELPEAWGYFRVGWRF